MAKAIAEALYLIGLLAVATGSREDPRLAGKSIWIQLALGILWPLLALLVVVVRVAASFRRG